MTIFHIPADEVELTAIRSQGPGGQNVNKVSSAIQLRFDIRASSLSMALKERLLNMRDHRITQGGAIGEQVVRDGEQHPDSGEDGEQQLIRHTCGQQVSAGVPEGQPHPIRVGLGDPVPEATHISNVPADAHQRVVGNQPC